MATENTDPGKIKKPKINQIRGGGESSHTREVMAQNRALQEQAERERNCKENERTLEWQSIYYIPTD